MDEGIPKENMWQNLPGVLFLSSLGPNVFFQRKKQPIGSQNNFLKTTAWPPKKSPPKKRHPVSQVSPLVRCQLGLFNNRPSTTSPSEMAELWPELRAPEKERMGWGLLKILHGDWGSKVWFEEVSMLYPVTSTCSTYFLEKSLVTCVYGFWICRSVDMLLPCIPECFKACRRRWDRKRYKHAYVLCIEVM